jgi:methyl-accepting chemotaxis protein
MNFKDVKIGTKLIIGYLIVTAVFTAASLYQLGRMKQLRAQHAAAAAEAGKVQLVNGFEVRLSQCGAVVADALSRRSITETGKRFEEFRLSAASDMQKIGDIAETGQERQWADSFKENCRKLLDVFEKELLPLLADRESAGREDAASGEALEEKIRSAAAAAGAAQDAAKKPLEKLVASLVEKNTRAESGYAAFDTSTGYAVMIMSIFGLFVGIGIALFYARLITAPVNKAAELASALAAGEVGGTMDVRGNDETGVLARALNATSNNLLQMVMAAASLAAGDLTVKIQPLSDRDGMGHALQGMVARLAETIADIGVLANNVAAGADQMSATSQAVSQGAAEQASSLEEISSSMNEITSQTRHNAENSAQANRLAAEAKALAENGNTQMQQMVSAMHEINNSSRNISRIIKVIDEIAFQTNLLALNAAVEAARAGRHGKGFAVVAEEVRNLAARSARAAKETSDMIEGSVRTIDGGAAIADKTAQALKEIVGAASKLTDLVNEIAAASNEQAQGVTQILAGLGQVDHVTQQNTAHAEESAAAAEELSSQARVLQELVSVFVVDRNLSAGMPLEDGSRNKLLSIRELRAQAGE